jgi:hypothetical protein
MTKATSPASEEGVGDRERYLPEIAGGVQRESACETSSRGGGRPGNLERTFANAEKSIRSYPLYREETHDVLNESCNGRCFRA